MASGRIGRTDRSVLEAMHLEMSRASAGRVPPWPLQARAAPRSARPFGRGVAPVPRATAFGSGRRRAELVADRAGREWDAARVGWEAAKVAATAAEGEAKGLREALAEARRPFWRGWLGP